MQETSARRSERGRGPGASPGLALALLCLLVIGSPAAADPGEGASSGEGDGTPASAPAAPASGPAAPTSAPATARTTSSVISVPITLSLNELFGELRSSVPEAEERLDRWYEMPPGSGHHVQYAWRRDPLDMSLKGLRFEASTRLHYKLRYGVPRSSINPFTRSDAVVRLGSLGFGGSEPRVDMRFVSELRFGEDWRLHTETRIEPTLVDAIRLPFVRLDVSSWVSELLQLRLAEKARELDAEVAQRTDLRPLAEKAWRRLSRPLPLGGRKAWLRINPEGFALSPLEVEGDGVTIRLQLRARPEVVLTESAPVAPGPLPPLAVADAPPGFRLGMAVDLPYPEATRTLRRLLVGSELGLGVVDLGVEDVKVEGHGGQVRLALDVVGAITGRMVLTGTPRLEPESGDLTVPDLDYTLESQGLLEQFGNWALRERLRDEIRRRARWNVGGTVRSLRRSSEEALDRPLGEDLQMQGELGGLTVDALTTDETGIRAHLSLWGDVRVRRTGSP